MSDENVTKTTSPGEIWVVTYGHRHGTDNWVTATRDEAVASLVGIAIDYLHEIPTGCRQPIVDQIVAGDFGNAVDAYFEASGGESFEITRMKWPEPFTRETAAELADRAVAELAALQEVTEETHESR